MNQPGHSPRPEEDLTTPERKRLLGEAIQQMASARESKTPLRILDAACGDGTFTAFLKELGVDVVGLDLSESAVHEARARCPGVNFHVISLEEKLPFETGDFDAIWCSETLEHLVDVLFGLREFHRILKGSGRLFGTVPYHGVLKNLAISLTNFEEHFHPTSPHLRFFTRRTLAECLRSTGFEPLGWRGFGRFWPFWKGLFVAAQKRA